MGTVHRFVGQPGRYRWDGVSIEPYSAARPDSGTRQVLVGPADGAANFAVRYFEISAGAAATLDTHAHDHGVFILHGHGRVRFADGEHAVRAGDVVYVAPHEPHAFEAVGDAPLGFLCVVPARR